MTLKCMLNSIVMLHCKLKEKYIYALWTSDDELLQIKIKRLKQNSLSLSYITINKQVSSRLKVNTDAICKSTNLGANPGTVSYFR